MSDSQELWLNQPFIQSQELGYHSLGSNLSVTSPNYRKATQLYNQQSMKSRLVGSQSQVPVDLPKFSNSWSSGMSKEYLSQPSSTLPQLSFQGTTGKYGGSVNENEIRIRHALHAMLTVIKSLPNKMQDTIQNNPLLKSLNSNLIFESLEQLLKENFDLIKSQLSSCRDCSFTDSSTLKELMNDMKNITNEITTFKDDVKLMQADINLIRKSVSKLQLILENHIQKDQQNTHTPFGNMEDNNKVAPLKVKKFGSFLKNNYCSPVAMVTPQVRIQQKPAIGQLRQVEFGHNVPVHPGKLDILEFCNSSAESSPDIPQDTRFFSHFESTAVEKNSDGCKKTRPCGGYSIGNSFLTFSRPTTRTGKLYT